MKLRPDSKLALIRSAGASVARWVQAADDVFVAGTWELHANLLDNAHLLSSRALDVIHATTGAISAGAEAMGRRSEARAAASHSVVVASLPAAFRRTAATVTWLGETGTRRARALVDALFGGQLPVALRVDEQHRSIGRAVAAASRDGLDAFVTVSSIRAHLDEIGALRPSRQQPADEGAEP